MAPTDAVAGLMTQGLPADARILDAGCGTGQAGTLLAAAGFTHVDGADLSLKMREVAARLRVYKSLYHLDMTADYAPQIAEYDAPYDAVICVGCSDTARHMSATCRGSWTQQDPARRCLSR